LGRKSDWRPQITAQNLSPDPATGGRSDARTHR
jgi:hypothetical protein